jgi:hypothetical protein
MQITEMPKITDEVLKSIPGAVNDTEILHLLRSTNIGWKYMHTFMEWTTFDINIVSEWLNISEKTLRGYAKPKSTFKGNTQEHLLLLLSLYKHGTNVFGTSEDFEKWLDTENFFFDGEKPAAFLNTLTGIKFTDDRLTGLQYGDNV